MVSVCIASYNHARFLPAALDAILGQTFRDFEIVVVDDGSTDNSIEILQTYAQKHPQAMRVFTHPGGRHLGISATINLTVEKARGGYWCPHASDDVSYADRLERQVAFLESHPDVGWVYGVADRINKEGTLLEGLFGCDLSAFPNLVERLIFSNPIAGVTPMVRRECVLEVGPFEPGLLYSDWEFWVRLAARYPPAFLPGAVVKYRMHGNNTSLNVPRPENLKRNLDVITCLRRKAEAAGGELGRPRIKALLELRRAAYLFRLENDELARSAAAAAFNVDPALRNDLGQLAYYLNGIKSRPLALTVLRELGSPPLWLANKTLRSTLLRVGVYPSLRARMRRMFLWRLLQKLRNWRGERPG
jgi:glycosyltransferase involved in cell wall biosynthesis